MTHALFPPELTRTLSAAGIRSIRSTDSVPHPTNAIDARCSSGRRIAQERCGGHHERDNSILWCGPDSDRLVLSVRHPTGRLLVDCGLFQGSKTLKALNYERLSVSPGGYRRGAADTRAYRPSGLLPKLVREGFRGHVMATRGTIDLCSYMLPDAGSIQESEVAALNRRNTARGRPR